ncbi:SDR family oxidoreductase [Adhaeretor mobilis]|uniref:Putative oxidoreductase UxuB n=1 Tax=Adhaeretor mobilis TaxID=1930276 RepID=A0A517MYC2_9BACT|nr:SDR family oxidoreductase [Adhaeretor mobilis]QDS99880.1 putative oxidoreductase UxuB [Adhaeretor mobilis]
MSYLEKLFSFQDQVAVVIGGTGVLCGEMAEGLGQAGAHVVVAGRSEERGNARVKSIEEKGGSASFASVDAMSKASIQELCDKVLAEHGRVDAVVNGAGVNSATPYFEIEEEEFDKIIRSNLNGVHYSCQVFGKAMIDAGRGAILNVGSVTSFLPLSKVYTYAASKAAVLNLTKNVAREFAPHKVRVNCLCPGFFPAEQNRKILSEDRIADIMRHTPMDRFGDAEELNGATLLLLSHTAGSFITGEAIYVDGGFTAMTI